MNKIIIISILLVFTACGNDAGKQENKIVEETTQKKKINESALATKLYSQYYAEPKNQEEIDQNTLLDYAVDHGLDVIRTKTGLYYIIHEEGKGPLLQRAQPTRAHYRGYFVDGKEFDSSYKKGRPINFKVGQMVPGWNEALLLMNVGAKAQLLIPSRLAYGAKGFPGYVPPHTPLIFDIEILPLAQDLK